MKQSIFITACLLVSNLTQAQYLKPSFDKNTSIFSIGYGMGVTNSSSDLITNHFGLNSGYWRHTGPFYLRYERAVANSVGISINLAYMNHNLKPIYRYGDAFPINIYNFSVIGCYHLNEVISNDRVDVYGNLGLGGKFRTLPRDANGDRYSDTKFAPVIAAGIRYYVSHTTSFLGELGYDGLSIFKMGICFKLGKTPRMTGNSSIRTKEVINPEDRKEEQDANNSN